MFLEALIEYRLCLCVPRGGGDFVREGLCPCCKIHRGWGLCSRCKIHGGIMSTYTNLSRGGGVLSGGDINVLH